MILCWWANCAERVADVYFRRLLFFAFGGTAMKDKRQVSKLALALER